MGLCDKNKFELIQRMFEGIYDIFSHFLRRKKEIAITKQIV